LKKSGQLVKPIRRKPAPPIKFQKRRQLSIRAHNETLFVVAVRERSRSFALWNQSLPQSNSE
jgi:hypothetical protein